MIERYLYSIPTRKKIFYGALITGLFLSLMSYRVNAGIFTWIAGAVTDNITDEIFTAINQSIGEAVGALIDWFFNVLLGDMSLVGTRPPTVDEWEKYEYHHRARLAIRPGITGMWQISGRSDITDFEEVVKLDTKYIQNWSLALDLKILVQTVLAVVKRKGAM